jgi:hypothetical protein
MIVVLDGRRVVEQGTHLELMAHDGLYRHLNEVQTQVERDWARIGEPVAPSVLAPSLS